MPGLVRFAENVVATAGDWLRPTPTTQQQRLAERLVHELRELATHTPAGEQTQYWRATCRALHEAAEKGDPIEFMRWPPIAEAMVGRTTRLGTFYYWALRRSPDWRRVWAPALRRPNFGYPPPFLLAPWTDAISIQHGYHLLAFRQQTGRWFLDADVIIDVGGGYGSMARLVRALGYRGRYFIFDQPPVLALQRYYLALHGIDVSYASDANASQVVLCQDFDELLQSVAAGEQDHISVLSTWALSEMPFAVREQAERAFRLLGCASLLFAYQFEFEGLDNRRYFADLIARLGDGWTWHHSEMKFRPGHAYAFGVRHPPDAAGLVPGG